MAYTNTRSIEMEPYYHGWMGPEDINDIFARSVRNVGDFLIRLADPNKDVPRQYVLSVFYIKAPEIKQIKNFGIGQCQGKFHNTKYSFDTIQQMVEYHVAMQASIQDDVVIKTGIVCQSPWEREMRHNSIQVFKLLPDLPHEIYFGEYKTPDFHIFNGAIRQAKLETATVDEIREVLAEARVLKCLHHPNIINYIGFSIDSNRVLMVTESGEVLNQYLIKNPCLPIAKLDELCLHVAWGLYYLHSKRYIHREPMTTNCMVVNGKVKIFDFKYTVKGLHHTVDGSKACALRWVAPEVLTTLTYTQQSDVWSFGVLCWEVYNFGIKPYPGMKPDEIVVKIRAGYRLPFPPTVNKEIADTITAKCWTENAVKRYWMGGVVAVFERITGKEAERPDMGAMDPEIKAENEKWWAEREKKEKEKKEKEKKAGFFGFLKKK